MLDETLTLDSWLKRNKRRVLNSEKPVDWMGSEDMLDVFRYSLERGFYTTSRFLADYMLANGVPRSLICHRGYEPFITLVRNDAERAIELASLFLDLEWYHWLSSKQQEFRAFELVGRQHPYYKPNDPKLNKLSLAI